MVNNKKSNFRNFKIYLVLLTRECPFYLVGVLAQVNLPYFLL